MLDENGRLDITELKNNLEAFAESSKITVEQIGLIAGNYPNYDRFCEHLNAVCKAFDKDATAISILCEISGSRLADSKPATKPTPTQGNQTDNGVLKTAKKLDMLKFQ